MKLYPFIEAEKAEQDGNVAMACVLLKVSRSAYYEWSKHIPTARDLSDAELGDKIVDIHTKSRRTYGAPRILTALAEDGICVGQKRVARLMVRRGLVGRCKRRFKVTTTPDPERNSLAPDLIKRAFSPEAHELDTAWCGDITYIRTWEGWLYLATVIDLASRRVVGFAMADHMRADLVCDALEMAIEQRKPAAGLIFHTDRGSQYTSEHFRQLLSPTPRRPIALPAPPMLGQRGGRKLVRHLERGVDLPPGMADPHHGPPGHLRIHRGVLQPATSAQLAWQSHAGRLRRKEKEALRTQRHSSGIINLSVKAGQAQVVREVVGTLLPAMQEGIESGFVVPPQESGSRLTSSSLSS